MNITLDIERRLLLPVDHGRAITLLDDLEATIGRFPNLKKLSRIAEQSYLWEMRTMGVRIAKIAHDLSYAARYEIDHKAAAIRWQPVSGHGNARIAGEIRLARREAGTDLLACPPAHLWLELCHPMHRRRLQAAAQAVRRASGDVLQHRHVQTLRRVDGNPEMDLVEQATADLDRVVPGVERRFDTDTGDQRADQADAQILLGIGRPGL